MPGPADWSLVETLRARARSIYRGLRHGEAVELEMREEFRHHLAARTDDLMRQGLSREDADRRARREFGHQDSYRRQAREAMGLASFDPIRFSWLDVKLALRCC